MAFFYVFGVFGGEGEVLALRVEGGVWWGDGREGFWFVREDVDGEESWRVWFGVGRGDGGVG